MSITYKVCPLALLAWATACSGSLDTDRSGGAATQPGAGPSANTVPAANAEQPAGDGTQPASLPPGAMLEGTCSEVQAATPPLRRLTRRQYENSVRDLLQIEVDVASRVGSDETIGTFASNSSAPVSRVVVEQYRSAAELAAAQAVESSPVLQCQVGEAEAACAERVIGELAPKALRRPVTTDELARYLGLYQTYATDSHQRGLRVAVAGILQSPHFIYHMEFGQTATPASAGEVVALSDHELASRLSYFLHNSLPDDTLRSLADSGQLQSPEVLAAQTARLLQAPKARRSIENFHAQWLMLQELEDLSKDTELFPAFNPALAEAMQTEVFDFADHVLRQGDGTVSSLFAAPFTFASDDLLDLYGANRPAGAGSDQPVELDPIQRAGLLTRSGFLAAHAHRDQTSPVSRGVVVRENVLCQPLPSPPPNVDSTPPDPAADATTRERFAEHVADPTCSACHQLIDDIGLGFENYDAIGRFRTEENGLPVDASGNVVQGKDAEGPFNGAVELSQRLAQSVTVQDCVASQWFDYALGRRALPEDNCSLTAVQLSFTEAQGNIPQLLQAIATSNAFRLMQVGEK